MKGSDFIAAKLSLLLLLAVLAGWWAASTGAGGEEVPMAAAVAGALLLVLGVAGIYEGSSLALAWGISRVRRRVRGPPQDPPGSHGGQAEIEGPVDGARETSPTRTFGLPGAMSVFVAYIVGNAAVWIVLAVWVAVRTDGATGDFEARFLESAPPWVALSALGAVVAAFAVFRRLSPVSARALPGVSGSGPARQVLLGVAIGVGANLAYLALVPHLPVQPTKMPDSVLWEMLTREGAGRWIVLATAVLVAPAAEEFVFRGLMLEGLARTLGNAGGIAGAGVLFTLLHVPDTAHYWPATVMILVMGLLAGTLRVRTGYLGPAVGVHFGHNAVVAILWAL